MNDATSAKWLAEVIADHQVPCVSIYQPMARAKPPAAQNPRLFADLVDQVKQILQARYDSRTIRQILQKLESIPTPEFWSGDRDALAIFVSPDYLRVIDLLQPVDAQVFVADSFHIKPLIRIMQSADRYQLLCLELKSVRMFEGNQTRIEKLEPRHLPQNPWQVAGMTLSSKEDSASDLRGASRQSDEGNEQTEPVPDEVFFRAIDRAVWENYSRPSGLPLILCADDKTYAGFREVCKNPYLMPQGIMLDPHALPIERLREQAWKIMQPIYQQRLDRLSNDFRVAKAHDKGSDDVTQVAQAASAGRIGTLLVAQDKQIRGSLLRHSGLLEQAPAHNSQADDVLDDLAEMVLRTDGQVLVVPQGAMPTDTGVAAIYRY